MWVDVLGGSTCARNEWGFLGRSLRKRSSQEGGDSELSPMCSEKSPGFLLLGDADIQAGTWMGCCALGQHFTVRFVSQLKFRALDKGVTQKHGWDTPSVTWSRGTGIPWQFLRFNIWSFWMGGKLYRGFFKYKNLLLELSILCDINRGKRSSFLTSF